MNIAEAKQVPIGLVLESLGARYYRQTKPTEIWYFSYLRDEKHASLKADPVINKAIDFGHHTGQGDGIDHYCDAQGKDRRDPQAIREGIVYVCSLRSQPIFEKFRQQAEAMFRQPSQPAKREYSMRYKILSLSDTIRNADLKRELVRRKLQRHIVEEDIKQAYILDTKEKYKFNAFAWSNDVGGTEFCTYDPKTGKPTRKSCIGPKGISSWPASPKEEELVASVWFGKFNRSTWKQMAGPKRPDELHVLGNGDRMLRYVLERLDQDAGRTFKLRGFTDNDDSGSGETTNQALADYAESKGLIYEPMNIHHDRKGKDGLFLYNDLSEAYMDNDYQLELKRSLGLLNIAPTAYSDEPRLASRYGPSKLAP